MSQKSLKLGHYLKPADFIFISLALAFIAWSYVFFWQPVQQGHTADIIVNQKTVLTVSLHQNKIYKIRGAIGLSTIEVSQGKIRFTDSPCTKKFCIIQGWEQFSRRAIPCVPNDVLVSVNGTPDGFDSLNY